MDTAARWIAASIVTALLVTGCTTEEKAKEPAAEPPAQSQSPEPTTPSPTSSPAASPTKIPREDRRWIPHFVAADLRNVREAVAEEGLQLEVEVLRDCQLIPGLVLDQDPAPRTKVAVGDTVTVTVGRHPAAADCVSPPARPVARALDEWARGTGPAPAFAPEVRLLVGNVQTGSFTAAEALSRSSWQLPPYAEMSDQNLLDWMADVPLLQHSWGLTPYCLVHTEPLAAERVERLWWSAVLLTSSADSCMDVGAVQVWVDDEDRIEAVNFLSGAP